MSEIELITEFRRANAYAAGILKALLRANAVPLASRSHAQKAISRGDAALAAIDAIAGKEGK